MMRIPPLPSPSTVALWKVRSRGRQRGVAALPAPPPASEDCVGGIKKKKKKRDEEDVNKMMVKGVKVAVGAPCKRGMRVVGTCCKKSWYLLRRRLHT